MSKMNELSIDHEAYAAYVESENMVLRREGAEEMRIEITRALQAQKNRAVTKEERFGIEVALIVVAQATI